MSHMQSLAGFSGRTAPETRCTLELRAPIIPTGGSWPVRAVQRQARQQRNNGSNRVALRNVAARCAAVAGAQALSLHAPWARLLYYAPSDHAPIFPFSAEKAMEQLTLQPIKRIEGHVQLPGSKSLSNRVLLLAALSEGTTLIKNLLVRENVAEVKSVILLAVRPFLSCHVLTCLARVMRCLSTQT